MKRTMITSIGEYENITSEVESLEDALREYDKIKIMFGEREGLKTKDWVRVRNNFILKNEIDEEYQKMQNY